MWVIGSASMLHSHAATAHYVAEAIAMSAQTVEELAGQLMEVSPK
jgi:hypothetical protein